MVSKYRWRNFLATFMSKKPNQRIELLSRNGFIEATPLAYIDYDRFQYSEGKDWIAQARNYAHSFLLDMSVSALYTAPFSTPPVRLISVWLGRAKK